MLLANGLANAIFGMLVGAAGLAAEGEGLAMKPVGMRRVEVWLVVGALFLVAGSLVAGSVRWKMSLAAAAVAIVVGLLMTRLRGHLRLREAPRTGEARLRIERIRAVRAARMGPRRRR